MLRRLHRGHIIRDRLGSLPPFDGRRDNSQIGNFPPLYCQTRSRMPDTFAIVGSDHPD